MSARFEMPVPGRPSVVRFPEIRRSTLPSGLVVWTIHAPAAPLVAALLVVNGGAAADPAHLPGLTGLTAGAMDEGAGDRDAIALADAFTRLGTHLEVEVGSDITIFGLTMVSHAVPDALRLVGDVVRRPRLDAAGIDRVRDLRLSRLRQLSRSAGTVADRAFLSAVFGHHPYGHGAFGTTASLQAITQADVRDCWAATIGPGGATLIAAGDLRHEAIEDVAGRVFGDWRTDGTSPTLPPPPAVLNGTRVVLVDRPGSPQSELRIGHAGPGRSTPDYHALVTLNAVLGGQFSSRLNRNLRETRGLTYGVRSAFDMRRAGGSFSCDTSVQADGSAVAVSEILREMASIREPGAVSAAELDLATASLTRGYVRNFETPGQLARAASQLVVHGLGPEVFDDFVPVVTGLSPDDVTRAAGTWLLADRSIAVVVGDRAGCEPSLAALGLPIEIATPEF